MTYYYLLYTSTMAIIDTYKHTIHIDFVMLITHLVFIHLGFLIYQNYQVIKLYIPGATGYG